MRGGDLMVNQTWRKKILKIERIKMWKRIWMKQTGKDHQLQELQEEEGFFLIKY